MNPDDYNKPLTKGDLSDAKGDIAAAAYIAACAYAYAKSDPHEKHVSRITNSVVLMLFWSVVVFYDILYKGQPFDTPTIIMCLVSAFIAWIWCQPPTQKEWDEWNAAHPE